MYSAEERRIFGPYYDGFHDQVYADPLRVRRVLTLRLEGKPNDWLKITNSPDQSDKAIAVGKVAGAAVEAFGLVPFDPKTGKGADEAYCLSLLDTFLRWEDAKKSSPRSCPTSQPPTASGSDPTLATGSASTSTSTVRPKGVSGTPGRPPSSTGRGQLSRPVGLRGIRTSKPFKSLTISELRSLSNADSRA